MAALTTTQQIVDAIRITAGLSIIQPRGVTTSIDLGPYRATLDLDLGYLTLPNGQRILVAKVRLGPNEMRFELDEPVRFAYCWHHQRLSIMGARG